MLTAPTRLRADRRSAERRSCPAGAVCLVTDLLDQSVTEAGVWNVGPGGVCLVIESPTLPGARLCLDLRESKDDPRLRHFAEVVYAVELPSMRAMWLAGCAYRDSSPDAPLAVAFPPRGGKLLRVPFRRAFPRSETRTHVTLL